MIKRSILNELIKAHDLRSLEQHLIYSYLKNQSIVFDKSEILTSYFKEFESNSRLFLDVSALNINTIKELENCLELIIPQSDRKLNGAFFTPDYVINFILEELQPQEDHTNLDPSCGCGAFLIGLVDYYKSKYNKPIKVIVKENIFGSDILNYNILRTKIILTVYALQHNEVLENIDFNLYHQDSLKANWEQKFDIIIGNPPYVKFQDLSDENRTYLSNHWTTVEGGTFNLYFAFFELGYKLLKPTGKLGYITPNNYFTSLAGEAIRKFFQKKKCVSRIVDFSHKKVFDAQTYTAITFLNKQENETIIYDRIKDKYTPEAFLKIANGSANDLKDLNPKKWRLLKSNEQKNIKIIETIGTPIGKLFDIAVGIATLKDDIFFVNTDKEELEYYIKQTDNGTFKIEKEVTKPVYKISDFKTQQDLKNNNRRIIFPYYLKNGTATPIPENAFKEEFPFCYAYLISEKETLISRDKGKVNFEPFFVWGRTQGLTKTGKKILTPTFSQQPRFLLVEDKEAYFTNGYGIYFKQENFEYSLFSEIANPLTKVKNIDIVQKILNSSLMHYYITKTSVSIEGGYPCYQKNFIEKFTIPEFSEIEIEVLRSINCQQKIDEFLTEKYQLSLLEPNLSS